MVKIMYKKRDKRGRLFSKEDSLSLPLRDQLPTDTSQPAYPRSFWSILFEDEPVVTDPDSNPI